MKKKITILLLTALLLPLLPVTAMAGSGITWPGKGGNYMFTAAGPSVPLNQYYTAKADEVVKVEDVQKFQYTNYLTGHSETWDVYYTYSVMYLPKEGTNITISLGSMADVVQEYMQRPRYDPSDHLFDDYYALCKKGIRPEVTLYRQVVGADAKYKNDVYQTQTMYLDEFLYGEGAEEIRLHENESYRFFVDSKNKNLKGVTFFSLNWMNNITRNNWKYADGKWVSTRKYADYPETPFYSFDIRTSYQSTGKVERIRLTDGYNADRVEVTVTNPTDYKDLGRMCLVISGKGDNLNWITPGGIPNAIFFDYEVDAGSSKTYSFDAYLASAQPGSSFNLLGTSAGELFTCDLITFDSDEDAEAYRATIPFCKMYSDLRDTNLHSIICDSHAAQWLKEHSCIQNAKFHLRDTGFDHAACKK